MGKFEEMELKAQLKRRDERINELEKDLSELYQSLCGMYTQHKCGCGNPSCNRCVEDADNGEVLHRIGGKYQHSV